MANLNNDGIDSLIASLEKLGRDIRPSMKVALYQGAKVYADNLKAECRALSVDDDWAHKSDKRSTVTTAERDGLVDGLGIARHREEAGAVTTVIGWSGKNRDGKANNSVAAEVNSGTSIRNKSNFIRTANNKSKQQAQAAIEQSLEKSIKMIMEG